MQRANISPENSIKENQELWCFEVGTRFEIANEEAANEFMELLIPPYTDILDLGCGDGAAGQYFVEKGFFTIGVDVNEEKLERYPGVPVYADMYTLLQELGDNTVQNIFAHHSLEHSVRARDIIWECGRVLMPGGIYYAVVPAHDHLHTVHHVVFDNALELLPNGLAPIFCAFQDRLEPEFKCIATKPIPLA